MRLHALLILAFAVLHARTASIPDHIVPELEKKLSEAVKEVLDKDALALKDDLNDQELLDQVNAADNVVAESGPSVKTEDAPVSDDESTDIKRVEVDLKNPGVPQVQRHDFQSPEVYNEAKLKESSVSHTVAETQSVLHEGLLDITQKAQQPTLANEKVLLVRNSINELQENFSSHLRKLNDIIKKYSKDQNAGNLRTVAVVEAGSGLTPDLKKIETEFNSGIENLSEGVANLKADGDNTVSTTAAPGFNIFQAFSNALTDFQNTLQGSINNLSTVVQNALNATQPNAPSFLQGPIQVLSNAIRPQQQQQQQQPQQQQQQQQGFIPTIINTVQGWFSNTNPTTNAPQTEASVSSSTAAGSDAGVSTEDPGKSSDMTSASGPIQQSGSEDEVEAVKDVEGAIEKGHGGRPGSEYSDNSDGVGLVGEAASVENKNDIPEQPQIAEQHKENESTEKLVEEVTTKVENSDYKEQLTEQSTEITTKVEELQKMEETVTDSEPVVLVRSKEENIETEEIKTEEPKTELPSVKVEITTVLNDDLMMNDEPKVEERVSAETLMKEDYKIETTVLPVKEIENELGTEEIPTTEGIKEMLMTDGLLSILNSPVKEVAQFPASGTEVSEIEAVTEKEESTTNVEYIKAEEPITTLNPLVKVEDRNQEVPVTEVEITKVEDASVTEADVTKVEEEEVHQDAPVTEVESKKVEEEGLTTEASVLEEQNLSLEVLPKEEVKPDELEIVPTTEAPNVKENKEKREVKRRVFRRLIKRILL